MIKSTKKAHSFHQNSRGLQGTSEKRNKKLFNVNGIHSNLCNTEQACASRFGTQGEAAAETAHVVITTA